MKFRLVTAVWGPEYVDTFLRVGLRTLIADGNIPGLADQHEITYTINTTPQGAEQISGSPAYERLAASAPVRLATFNEQEIDAANYGSHGVFWNRALDLARRNGEVLFFIIPDLLYADGTLTRWAARFEAGAGAIFTLGPQVVLETVVPEIEERFPDPAKPCVFERDQIFDLLFRHLHPLHAAMRHDSERRPPHPEYDLRLVPERGYLIREIVSHPFCVDPQRFISLRHYGPQDHLGAIVFEPCSTVSIEPLLKRVALYYRPWPLDETRLSNMGGWWDCFTTAACEYESSFPFAIGAEADHAWQAASRRASAGGRFYRDQVVISGRLYQLFVELRNRELFRAANLLAIAIYACRLRRRLTIAESAIILLPNEAVLAQNAGRINELLKPGRERDFIKLISNHVILRAEYVRRRGSSASRDGGAVPSVEPGVLFTAQGLPAERLLHDVSWAGSFAAGPFTIYLVDRVLWEESSEATPAAGALRELPLPSPIPVISANPRPFVVTRWAQRSLFHRALYHGLHLPFLEPLLALIFPVYFVEPMKNVLRPYPFVHRIKDLWRAGRLRPSGMLGYAGQAAVRNLAAFPIAGPVLRRVYNLLRRGRSRQFLEIPSAVMRVVKRDGPALAWRKARARLRNKVSGATVRLPAQTRLSLQQRKLLEEIRALRSLQAISAVLGTVEDVMKASAFRSAPLAFIGQLLSGQGVDSDAQVILERKLNDLTEQQPKCAEAWLEFGFFYKDDGRPKEATTCFLRAAQAVCLVDVPGRDPHPVALAWAELGRLRMAEGERELAAAAFLRSYTLDPTQKVVAAEYANVLRQLGKIDEALTYCGEGMYFQEGRWALPSLPRDAGRLDLAELVADRRRDLIDERMTPPPRLVPRPAAALEPDSAEG